MDSSTTQGTSRASMIILATVVFPDALPPPRPAGGRGIEGGVGGQQQDHNPGCCQCHARWILTDDEGLLGLGAMLIVPGWSARRVDGAFPCAQQRGL